MIANSPLEALKMMSAESQNTEMLRYLEACSYPMLIIASIDPILVSSN